MKTNNYDVVIIGASASGLMCAIEAGKRGRRVIVLDHANKAGKKILMSGGGRCNFTNLDVNADHYISHNPHFCKSALSRYTQWDFIALVNAYGIAYHERDLGKLFCDESAKDILNLLLDECQKVNVKVMLQCAVTSADKVAEQFVVHTSKGVFKGQSLVVASGGLSIPKMCATPIGYQIAAHFNHTVLPTRAGLVPLTLQPDDKQRLDSLSGIAVHSHVSCAKADFSENILFTHRGLSGPAILQLSSYWQTGERILINLLPDVDLLSYLTAHQKSHPNNQVKTVLGAYLPKRLLQTFLGQERADANLKSLTTVQIDSICQTLQHWQIKPNGTEGYRTAEVTLGGIDCNEISSKTLQSNQHQGLYFIGEVLDISGWLGGYNFQWAWSSGWCAGQVV